MKAVAYMLDTSIWSKFAKEDVADYAIGGPTIELLFKSYNATHKTSYVAGATSNSGYQIKGQEGDNWSNTKGNMLKTEKPYVIKDNTYMPSTWLASPSGSATNCMLVVGLRNDTWSDLGYQACNYEDTGDGHFRPLVCLKSGIHLEKSDDGNYEIVDH